MYHDDIQATSESCIVSLFLFFLCQLSYVDVIPFVVSYVLYMICIFDGTYLPLLYCFFFCFA